MGAGPGGRRRRVEGVDRVSTVAQNLLDAAMADHRRGDIASAERGYRAILALQPKHPDALHLLGRIHGDRGEYEQAFALIGQALKASPNFADAHFNLSAYLIRTGNFADAESHLRTVAKLQPQNATAQNNLGGVLLQLQRYKDAAICFDKALQLDPELATALTNYAIACEVEGRFDDVLPAYDRLLARDPENVTARYYRALTLLSRERFGEGWAEYVWRWRRPDTAAKHGVFALPYWAAEALDRARVLVWTEQGPGDEILIASMLPGLLARGAAVTLLCSPRMTPLFRRSFPDIAVVDKVESVGAAAFDFQASLSELGRYLRPTQESFGAPRAFLQADAARRDALRAHYRGGAQTPLVGISWRSRATGVEGEKSLALSAWEPILRTPGVQFVCLQYGDCADEVRDAEQRFGIQIRRDATIDPLTDLDSFASQVAAMDLVISVSNTTVHFAGGLGLPTWVMVPAARGRIWYWFLNRTDSPWYAGARLVRQAQAGQWSTAIDEVAARLRTWTPAP